jgi:hypothetical protein
MVNINNDEINSRIKELDNLIQSTKYSKQKSALQENMISFLPNLTQRKSLDEAFPEDIRTFLVYKEKAVKHKCERQEIKESFIPNVNILLIN